MTDFLERVNATPVTFLVLLAYLTMAAVTGFADPSTEKLLHYGALTGVAVQQGEPWRLLSHAFLHGGWMHLGFNSYFLFLVGPALEQALGSVRFTVLYVVAAIGGAFGGALWSEAWIPIVGGSGALFGMMGAVLAMNMRQGRHLLDFMNYVGPRQVVSLVVLNLMIGFVFPRISNAAHIGGLIAGFALTFCFLVRGRDAIDNLGRVIRAGWIALFASLLLHSVRPVARQDWIADRLIEAIETESGQQQELLEALLQRSDNLRDIHDLSPDQWRRLSELLR